MSEGLCQLRANRHLRHSHCRLGCRGRPRLQRRAGRRRRSGRLLLGRIKFALLYIGFIDAPDMTGNRMEMRNILRLQKSGKRLASDAVCVVC